MRSGFKLVLLVGSAVTLVSSMAPASPVAVASTSNTTQLQARRAQLEAQLQQLSGPRASARAQLVAAERAYAALQAQIQGARTRLDAIDASLLRLSRQIASDQHDLTLARAQLGTLIRATYEATAQDGFATAILSSDSFTQAVDRVRGAQHVTDQVRRLQGEVADRERSLLDERAALQKQFADAQALEGQLTSQGNQLMALVAQRDAAFNLLDGPARSIADQIASIDGEMAAPPSGSGPCGNHFAYGNCTYYVATRRCIPWFGNAYQWWSAAAAYGYAEGHTPVPGAVAVWGQGGSSPDGHVAYVEVVGPNGGVPAGSFRISEMNWDGWDQVDYRTVPDNSPGLLGFIYGHS